MERVKKLDLKIDQIKEEVKTLQEKIEKIQVEKDLILAEIEAKKWEGYKDLPDHYKLDDIVKRFDENNVAVEYTDLIPEGFGLPSFEMFQYLGDETDYSFDRESKEGVFTFKNGFELRFPAAGYRNLTNGAPTVRGQYGYYWSSSANSEMNAWRIDFYGSGAYLSHGLRANGMSVRCVAL